MKTQAVLEIGPAQDSLPLILRINGMLLHPLNTDLQSKSIEMFTQFSFPEVKFAIEVVHTEPVQVVPTVLRTAQEERFPFIVKLTITPLPSAPLLQILPW